MTFIELDFFCISFHFFRLVSVTNPMATPLPHIHDALACYATPSVMHQPLILNAEEEQGILDSLRNAFDDPVSVITLLFKLC